MASANLVMASDDASAQRRKGGKRPVAAAAVPAASQIWGPLTPLAGTAWLDEKSGDVIQYRWKLRNEILAIETYSRSETEPQIDEVRLAPNGLSLTRVTVQPTSAMQRQYVLEMPRAGVLIEAEAVGATITRRTLRLTPERIFVDSEITVNGATRPGASVEWRKLSSAELPEQLGRIAAAQAAQRAEQAELAKVWGPFVQLAGTDWKWRSGKSDYVSEYRWREPGKSLVVTHNASRKGESYQEIVTLDPASGALTGTGAGGEYRYSLEDGAIVATASSNKIRTTRKLIDATSYQLVTHKRKGESWIPDENILVQSAVGGVPTVPIQLMATSGAIVSSEALQVAVPIAPPAAPDRAEQVAVQQAAPPAPPEPAKKKGGGLLATLGRVGEVMVATTGANLLTNALTKETGIAMDPTGASPGGQSILGAIRGNPASASGGGAPSAPAGSAAPAGKGYAARPNILSGHPACRGYTVDNYKQYFQQNSKGPDVQLHSLCAGAYNYYWMYLNAIRQGYSQADSDRTYAAFTDSAKVAINFYETAR
ncbi:hypothetical protein [Sphingomonas sp. CCH9-E2]|uniref:hypothetical protein n=1 Tax=Sphingomonas sp. CCH9-E2 TaxID=1768776 RepID=UPI0012E3B55C|nr:hypothetical protein [Sphingomonas sp. CCH9-E2]